jgi:deazaflavin-dependent oxidoreductase (nitroreductase family)
MPMRAIDRQLGLRLLNLHQVVYERTGGLVGARIGNVKLLLMRTRGRRSGQVRTVSLLYEKDGDGYVVVGSKGGSDTPPAWLLNLLAEPDCEVQVGTRRFDARARIARGAERKRLWSRMVSTWPDYDRYQSQTKRQIPIVILEPVR